MGRENKLKITIPTQTLLLYPQLMSQIRAMPRQAFLYSYWIQNFCLIEITHSTNNVICSQNSLFQISVLCDLIGDYAAVYPDEKSSHLLTGPSATIISDHFEAVKERQREAEAERRAAFHQSPGPGWDR